MLVRFGFVIFLVVLGACAPRGVITLAPDKVAVGQPYTIFLGTTRAVDETGAFDTKRQAALSFARYVVTVPPEHRPGKIEWPHSTPDPARHFLTRSEERFESAQSFRHALARELRAEPAGSRDAVIYIHGYNNTYAEGIYRLAQLRHDFDLTGPAVHYSWPSAANPLGYGYDRDSVLFARDGLEELIRTVHASGAEQVILVGHSLGALLTVETIRQMAIADARDMRRLIGGVILVSPDIDVEVFHQQAAKIGPLPQPFVIFTSGKDRTLRLSAQLTGQRGRLGNVTDAAAVADLKVTILDVTQFSKNPANHFVAATSPALIGILGNLQAFEAAFRGEQSGRIGLLPGTVLAVQNATQIILSPIAPQP